MVRLTLLAALCALAPIVGAAAGGNFATVTLDEPTAGVVVDQPWRVGFTVKRHDVEPINDVTPRLAAEHRGSGARLEAVATRDGADGHFVAEVTFPEAGEWAWSVTPEPFPTFDLPALTVASTLGDQANDEGASAKTWNIGRRGHEVLVADLAFSPASLTIERGEAVVWRNDDAVAHTIAGDDRVFADSGLMGEGDLFVQVFDQPGVYRYHCTPHPGMVGTITVR